MGWFSKKDNKKDVKADEKDVKVSSEEKKKDVVKDVKKDEKDVKTEKKSKPADSKVPGVAKQVKKGIAYKVLVRPLITEKATEMAVLGKYVFEVAKDTNKVEVAKAIEEVYGIKPSSVNIVKMLGKKVRRGKITGKRKDWKKAIVTLPKGKTIEVYEGV